MREKTHAIINIITMKSKILILLKTLSSLPQFSFVSLPASFSGTRFPFFGLELMVVALYNGQYFFAWPFKILR